MASTAVRHPDYSYSNPSSRHRLFDLMRRTRLNQVQVAKELEIADRLLEQWCVGQARPPKWAYLALEGIFVEEMAGRIAIVTARPLSSSMPRYSKPTRRQQLRHLLAAAGLTDSTVAAELEIEGQ
jgi:hypothetical protein